MKNFDVRLFDSQEQSNEYQMALNGEWTSATFEKRRRHISASKFSEDWDKARFQLERTAAFLNQYYPD